MNKRLGKSTLIVKCMISANRRYDDDDDDDRRGVEHGSYCILGCAFIELIDFVFNWFALFFFCLLKCKAC